MKLTPYSGEALNAAYDIIIFGVTEGTQRKSPGWQQANLALDGALGQAMADEGFAGKDKQTLILHTLGRLPAKRVAWVGLGRQGLPTSQSMLRLGSAAARLARQAGARRALIVAPKGCGEPAHLAALGRGALVGCYTFRRWKTRPENRIKLHTIAIGRADGRALSRAERAALEQATLVAEAVRLARDLVNEPALTLYPESFVARARAVARDSHLGLEVLGPAQLARLGAGLLLGVGAGSARPPRLVHLIYKGKGRRSTRGRARPLVLVGKGITFDSGGLSIKPAASMETMKSDMAGAAVVLACLRLAAALGLADEVHGVLALAENMPSSTAIRPGDVLKSVSGKSVEVVNTDAEGRLVLADAITYAKQLSPRAIIDVATLTGACVVALGAHTVGLFANDDGLAQQVLESANRAGEHFWRLPLTPMLRDQLKSEVADLKNTGAREGAAITAALFLSEFVGDTPWVHLDIAGPAMSKGEGGADTKGGTGVAIATLADLLAPMDGSR